MKEKAATLRDVAKKAGVSVATVSYVLNYSVDQKISHDTRIKVLQAAVELNYNIDKLNRLMTKECEKKQIGVVVSFGEFDRMSSACTGFMRALWEQASVYGYAPVFFQAESMVKKPDKLKNHDYNGLFYVGMRQKDASAIASHQYLPAILMDCHYEDDLFFKLMPDYEEAVKLAMGRLGQEICVVMEAYQSEVLKRVLNHHIPQEDIYVYDEPLPTAAFHQFVHRNQGRGFLVVGDLLALHMKKFVEPRKLLVFSYLDTYGLNSDLCKVLIPVRQIAEQGMAILEKMIKLKDVEDLYKNQYFPPKFTYPKVSRP